MCGDPNKRKVHPWRQLPAAVTDPEGHHFSGTQLEPPPEPRPGPGAVKEPSICKIKQLMPGKILCQID